MEVRRSVAEVRRSREEFLPMKSVHVTTMMALFDFCAGLALVKINLVSLVIGFVAGAAHHSYGKDQPQDAATTRKPSLRALLPRSRHRERYR